LSGYQGSQGPSGACRNRLISAARLHGPLHGTSMFCVHVEVDHSEGVCGLLQVQVQLLTRSSTCSICDVLVASNLLHRSIGCASRLFSWLHQRLKQLPVCVREIKHKPVRQLWPRWSNQRLVTSISIGCILNVTAQLRAACCAGPVWVLGQPSTTSTAISQQHVSGQQAETAETATTCSKRQDVLAQRPLAPCPRRAAGHSAHLGLSTALLRRKQQQRQAICTWVQIWRPQRCS
jgi:hypothetical protein